MNEENKSNYYAVIPATVRYDKELKPAEKLLYGEITALANKYGYCFAQNRYFAELYNVTIGTVSKWLSHLQSLNYITIVIDRNNKNEVISRRIYIIDNPYIQKRQYPSCEKESYPIVKNDKYNNININKIDELFLYTLTRDSKISKEFYYILDLLGFLYDEKTVCILAGEKKQMIKEIIYTLYELEQSLFKQYLYKLERERVINLYLVCKDIEQKNLNTKNEIGDFIQYFKRALINQFNK